MLIETDKTKIESVCDILRDKIRNGELANTGTIPSIRKLVDRLDCNRNVVWRALLRLKDERYVAATPSGRYHVHPRFQLNHPAQTTLKVAFVGTGESALASAFIQGIHTALAGNQDGYNIQLELRLGTEANKLQAADLFGYDAIILAASWSFPFYATLKKKGKLVTSLIAPQRYNIPAGVRVDDFHGGELAGRAYSERALQHIVVLGESNYYPDEWQEAFELRILGFRRSWLQNGQRTRAIAEYPLPVDLLSRMKAIERIVDMQEHPVGYFALSDTSALMLHSVLCDRGIKIPDEAQIIGFDNLHDTATVKPSLSTLCPDPGTFSKKLVEQLRFIEADWNHNAIVYIKPRLLARESLKTLDR